MDSSNPVKVETDNGSHIGYMDDDDDSGELSMSDYITDAWLGRVSHDLWTALRDLAADKPVQVGVMRVWENGNVAERIKLQFEPDLKGFELIPKEYDLSVCNENSKNLFVFAEKNESTLRYAATPQPIKREYPSTSGNRSKGIVKKNQMLRSIRRQTSLSAAIKKEISIHPVMNEEYFRLQDLKLKSLVEQENSKTTHIGSKKSQSSINVGTVEGFIKTTVPPRNAKFQENKNIRIPQNELLDLIGQCFREFKYWPLKALKQRLNQPDVYLKETLQKIAMLIKSGPFANNWALLPEMEATLKDVESIKNEVAPNDISELEKEDMDPDDDNFDDDEEMEDII